MTLSMRKRILDYAVERRHEQKWKKRMYALLYNCRDIAVLASMK
jgi:hypothetical protein